MTNAPTLTLREAPPDVEAMSLEVIQAELRAISGTRLRSDADAHRRQALWRRLDALVAGRDQERPR